jgi:S-DNA-T family DNA segregation ATPase FtsK/SpoIIIE
VWSAVSFLRCIVVDAGTGVGHDVEIEFDPAASTSSLLAALPVDVRGRPVFAGPARLGPGGTLGESPLTAGVVISVGAPSPDLGAIPGDAAGVLRVVSGPDAGHWTWIPAGSGAVVGRGDNADLLLTDPKASRPHAEVTVEAALVDPAVMVRDLGSANGTTVGGVPVQGPTRLPEHGGFEIGDSLIEWIPLDRVKPGWRRSPDGRVEFTRRFHNAPEPEPATVGLPPSPHESARGAVLLMTSIGAPLAIGLVMWAMTQSIAFLAMTVITPLTFGGQHFYEKRRKKTETADFVKEQNRAKTEIATAVAAQEQIRRLNDPDELSLTLSALGALPRLWTKRLAGPDALTVRVGTRDEPAAVQLTGDRWKGLEKPKLRAVPVTVDLRATGVLGLVGDRPMVEGLARWLLVQLATRRSPEDLLLAVLSRDDGRHLRWTRWLPHLDTGLDGDAPCRIGVAPTSVMNRVRELQVLVEGRLKHAEDEQGMVSFDSDVVVVLDGAHELRNLTGMRTILTRGPEVGVYAVCLDETDINECRGRVAVGADGRLEVVRTFSAGAERATAETTTLQDAERIARLLAPLRDRAHASGAEGAIPYPVRYLDLLAIHTPTPDDVLGLWRDHPGPTTRVPLGADAQGTVDVDIAVQGPHTMLAGATGAGKSILLQTLVVSLLLHNRPDELNLLLVDFKGGAAFQSFEVCSQVVGVITSTGNTPEDTFDAAAAERVLTSIRAEVQRRERLLAAYGGEISAYLERRPAGEPPLPRLLMVFDEYARVLDAAPDFVKELVNVAGKGRSLGMHLLLATQSLVGKLTGEMKNNIELRISLRQNQADESMEVLDVPDAAAIPGRLRGRGLILSTKDEPRLAKPFQAGYLGAPPPTAAAPPATVRIVDWPAVGDSRPQEADTSSDQPTDQELLIAAIEQATNRLGLPRPFRPLLPALPVDLGLDTLTAVATEPCPDGALPFGLFDEPARQAQPPAVLSLTGDDRLMIAGGAGSGRSTAVRALIHSAVARYSPDDLHLYVIEQKPGLAAYEGLPHCGGVFGPAEPGRIRNFVGWLGAETERRIAVQFDLGERPPTLLVLIDGWELFHDPADGNSIATSMVGVLRQVISDGPKVGVHVVVACGRGPLTSKPADLFNQRLVLPFPSADVVRSQLPTGSMMPLAVRGRAADAGTGRHLQIARPEESAEVLVGRLAVRPAVFRPARAFPPLPRRVHSADLWQRPVPADVTADWIPLGLGGPEVTPVGVDLFAGPQSLLVSGPGKSGRSSVAATTVLGLTAIGVGCVVLCPPRSPLVELLSGRPRVAVLVGPKLSDELVRTAAQALGTERIVLVADDCESLEVTATSKNFDELPTLLEEAISPPMLGRMGLVLCGNGYALLEGRRPLTNLTRRVLDDGTRVLLTPTVPGVAREHRIILEADQYLAGPPCRGYLAREREQLLVQLGDTGG